MAFNYTAAEATAHRLIANFGQAATLRLMTTTGGSAFDPTSGTQTTTNYSVTLVETDYTRAEIAGGLVERGDKKLLLSTDGLTVTPALSDKIVMNSVVYAIIDIKPINPGGTVLLYEIQARL